jgi:Bor protein
MIRKLVLLGVVLAMSGCYHATVVTGAAPGSEKVEKEWASGWVFGLVAPDTMETQSKCPAGVSKVETEHSFLNALVAFFTIQIYTPMHITATCSAGGGVAPAPATPAK